MWPRRERWRLMPTGKHTQGAALPDRFGAAVDRSLLGHTGLGPHYGTSGDIYGAKNNAAINAAMDAGGAGAAGAATGKKGLNWKNFMNAAGKLKSPTGMDFGSASGRAGGPRPTAPSPRALGVDALEMASADDPRKKWWKQWQGLMGA